MEDHGRYRVLARRSTTPPARRSTRWGPLLGLGYPRGPVIDRIAVRRRPPRHRLPPGDARPGYDFSFSGLKTAVVNHVRKHPEVPTADVAASFQAAVVDVLVTKARRAAAKVGAKGLCLGGGVAANSVLRERCLVAQARRGRAIRPLVLPPARCAPTTPPMVAAAGWWRLQSDGPTPLDAGATLT